MQLPNHSPVLTQLYTAQESRVIDARVMSLQQVDAFTLVQRAAEFAFGRLLFHFPTVRSMLVWCGKGNNAADAYVVAALAARFGIAVEVRAVVPPTQLTGEARRAHDEALAAGVILADTTTPVNERADIILDGLLGTGTKGAPRTEFAKAITTINQIARSAAIPVVSLDVPSGVDASTGGVSGSAVTASMTISFITQKAGLFTGPGVSYAGLREFGDLGAPRESYIEPGVALCEWIKPVAGLDPNTYKHRNGTVVIVGGDHTMPGAVTLAARACLRSGAGLVTVVTRPAHTGAIIGHVPEAMVASRLTTPQAAHGSSALSDRADLIVLGPGLGRSAWGQQLYEQVEASGSPVVLDADGLYWLAQRGVWRGGPLSITPHTGEAAALLGISAHAVQNDRLAAVQVLREKYAEQVVLKGAGSIIATPAQVQICRHGNPGMATAGMGDVLSGVIGGRLAAIYAGGGSVGAQAEEEALGIDDVRAQLDAGFSQAVALHSAAADAAVAEVGEMSLIASDVIEYLPRMLL